MSLINSKFFKSRKFKIIASLAIVVIVVASYSIYKVFAASVTYYWVGSTDGANTSVAGNWSTTAGSACGTNGGVAVPGSADIVNFSSSCTNGATIDSALSVTTFNINTGYTGTITQNATLTIAGVYTQSAGTFNSANTITLNLGGGTPWVHASGSGTFNGGTGTVIFNAFNQTMNASGETFNNLTINTGISTTQYLAVTGSVTVNGTLTATRVLNSGTINAKGAVTFTAGGATALGGGTVYINGSSGQAITIGATALPNINISNASASISYNGAASFNSLTLASGFSTDTFSLGANNASFGGTLSIVDGTFNAGSATVTFNVLNGTAFSHTAGQGTFVANSSTFVFASYNQAVAASGETFNNISVAAAGTNQGPVLSGPVTIAGNLSVTNGAVFGGQTAYVLGNITFASAVGAGPNGASTIVATGTAAKVITFAGSGAAAVGTLTISNPSITTVFNAAGTITTLNLATSTFTLGTPQLTVTTLNLTGGTLNAASGPISVTTFSQTAGTFNASSSVMTAWTFTLAGGTFNAQTGTINLTAQNTTSWSHALGAGTFNAGTGSVVFNPWNSAPTMNANGETFYNLTVAIGGNTNVGLTVTGTITVNNTLTQTGGGINGGTVNAYGNVVFTSGGSLVNNTATINIASSSAQTVTFGGGGDFVPNINISVPATINYNGTTTFTSLTLASGFAGGTFSLGTYPMTVTNGLSQAGGTFNAGSNNLTIGAFTLTGGIFNAQTGNITTTYANTTVWTHAAGSGTFNAGTGTLIIGPWNAGETMNATGETFYNLTVSIGGNTTVGLTVTGTINVTNNLTETTGRLIGGTINVGGNISIASGNTQGTSNIVANGSSGVKTLSGTGLGTAFTSGTFTVNNPGSTLQLSANFTFPTITISANSTLDMNTFNITGAVVVACSGTLIRTHGEMVSGGVTYGAATATKYWVGATNALASASGSWAATSGGVGGVGVPGQCDAVVFDFGGNTAATVDINNWTINSLTIGTSSTSYTSTVTFKQTTGTTTILNNVVVNSGTITHFANSTLETYKLIMNVGGNMTVASGAKIDTTGTGYNSINGPGHGNGNGGGASYGGQGGENPLGWYSPASTYGSITAPINIGSGGGSGTSGGGGAVILNVTGTSTINGTVSANANPACGAYCASGGSVYITTGYITGTTGLVSVNGAGTGGGSSGAGGGGRISLILTQASATFSSFTSSTVTAYGGVLSSENAAAGTIYEQTGAQASGAGTLIIDNNNVSTTVNYFPNTTSTLLPASTNLYAFSSIIIRNGGNLGIQTGTTFNVASTTNFTFTGSSTSYLTAASGAVVTVPAAQTISNYSLVLLNATTTTAGDLTIASGGALILGQNQFQVAGNLTVNSGGWISHMGNAGSEVYKANLSVGGNFTLNAGGQFNTDGMGYHYNGCGGPGCGRGNGSGASYGGLGALNVLGTAGIAQTYGSITAPVNIGSNGGSFTGNTMIGAGGGAVILNVVGTSTINGMVSSNATACNGNCGSGGSVFITTGTIIGTTGAISANGNGSGGGTTGAGGGGRISIVLTGLGANFSNFTSSTVTAYGGVLSLENAAAGTIYEETQAQGAGHGTLIIDNNNTSTTANYFPYSVYTLMPSSTNFGSFASIIIRNKGNMGVATSTTLDFATANLSVTGSSTSYITAASGGTISIPSSYTLSSTTLTMLNATTTTAGDFTLGTSSALVLGQNPFQVTGNFAVVSGAYISGLPNANAEIYKINISVGGNFTFSSGAAINANGLGYAAGASAAPGFSSAGGAGYGGLGGLNSDTPGGNSYGSITAPTNIGSGNGVNSGNGGAGGGAVIMTVAGLSTINGAISANAGSPGAYQAAGSGGAVFITTGSISGSTGSITTTGGYYNNAYTSGAGGRVSLVLTSPGADFSSFTDSVTAYTGSLAYFFGAAGTIYEQTTAQGAGGGTLIVDNNNIGNQFYDAYTLLPNGTSPSGFAQIIIRNKGNMGVATSTTLDLSASNLVVSGATSSIVSLVPGGTFVFPANYTLQNMSLNIWNQTLTASSNITIASTGQLIINKPFTLNGNLTVNSGGNIMHSRNTNAESFKVNMTINGNFNLNSGGTINVNGLGYADSAGIANAPGYCANGGAGYGGWGGLSAVASCGRSYGSITAPTNIGSGGGNTSNIWDPNAGGAVIMTVSGLSTINGAISANGIAGGYQTAGSGGSVFITTGTITGTTGTITTTGAYYNAAYPGGSGGRVSLVLTTAGADFSNFNDTVTAYGGSSANFPGAGGTIYEETPAQGTGHGNLIIGNSVSTVYNAYTDLGFVNVNSLPTLGSLQLPSYGKFVYNTGASSTFAFATTSPGTTISGSSTATFLSYNALTIPGTTNFLGAFNASSTSVTYTGWTGSTTLVDMLPGTYGSVVTYNTTSGITYQLSGNLVDLSSYQIPCHVTLDLNGWNWQGTVDTSNVGLPGCNAILLYNGGSINGAGQSGGAVTQCISTGNITGGSYSSYSITGNGVVCTLTGNVIATSTVSVNNGATLSLNGYALNTNNLTLNSGTTLKLQGAENLSATGTVTGNGTVIYTGNGNSSPDSYVLKSIPFTNLQVAFTDAVDSLVSYFKTSANTGLVGYWKLDDTATPAVDSSGYGNSGTWVNAPVVDTAVPSTMKFTDPRGLALASASSRYINLGDPASLEPQVGANGAMTISAWIKPTTLPAAGAAVVAKYKNGGGANNQEYWFGINDATGKITGQAFGGDLTKYLSFMSTNAVSTGVWSHVAMVYDNTQSLATNKIKIYINGAPATVTNGSVGSFVSIPDTTISTFIGGNDNGAGGVVTPFNGSLDDVRIYNRALSPDEVATLASGYPNEGATNSSLTVNSVYTQTGGNFYAAPTMTVNGDYNQTGGTFVASTTLNVAGNYTLSGSSFFNPNNGTVNLNGSNQTVNSATTINILSSGLAGYWKFDEGSGTSATDSSGNTNTATLQNSPTWSNVHPSLKFTDPYSVSFSGSTQYVSAPSSPSLDITGKAISTCAWVYPTVSNVYQLIVAKTNNTTRQYGMFLDSGGVAGIYATIAGTNQKIPLSINWAVNSWNHICVTWDGTTERAYVNGSLSGTLANGGTISSVASSVIEIGSEFNQYNLVNGKIDDVRIYNRALSATEVAMLAGGYGPVANPFYNLTKTVLSPSTLTFTAGQTTTVLGTTTFQGIANNLLSLISSVAGTQWKFDPEGGLNLANLSVRDSNNINASTTNLNPIINAQGYTGVVDGSPINTVSNTNWTFILPLISFTATGTQVVSTPLPVTNMYMGGAFLASSSNSTSTVTSIKITQDGTLPTANITNVQLLYANATNGLCATSTLISYFPGGVATNIYQFGSVGTWNTASSTMTIPGSMVVGSTPVCVYARFTLYNSGGVNNALLGDTVDLQVANPSTDVISAGTTIAPSTTADISGSTVVNGSLSLAPTVSLYLASTSFIKNSSTTINWSVMSSTTPTCLASASPSNANWSGSKTPSGSVSTGNLSVAGIKYYYLVCTNNYGTATSTAYATIYDPDAPIISFYADSGTSYLTAGGSTNLHWSVSNSMTNLPPTGCSSSAGANGWSGSVSGIGGGTFNTGALYNSQAYTLTCTTSLASAVSNIIVYAGTPPTPCVSGALTYGTCGATGSGSTVSIDLVNSDGTMTKFFLESGALVEQRQVVATQAILSSQILTDPSLNITSASFTKVGNSGLRVQMTIQKRTVAGSIQNYTVQKTFNLTAEARGKQ